MCVCVCGRAYSGAIREAFQEQIALQISLSSNLLSWREIIAVGLEGSFFVLMFACASEGHGQATVHRLSLLVVFMQAITSPNTIKYIYLTTKYNQI